MKGNEWPRAKLSSRWQVSIPKEIRLLLGAKEGDYLQFRVMKHLVATPSGIPTTQTHIVVEKAGDTAC